MPRSFTRDEEKGLKGQWFLISAVIATGGFLAISLLYQGYFVADPSKVTYNDMNQQFMSISNQLESVRSGGCNQDVLEHAIRSSKKLMAEKGYFLTIINSNCNYDLIHLSSGDYEIWEGNAIGIASVE